MNQLKLISKYRSQLMALAILSVMIYHLDFRRYFHFFEPIFIFFDMNHGCVDAFFFLSGFSLFYASLKKETVLRFYSNRFIRILPSYILIIIVSHIVTNNYSLHDFWLEVSTIGFWQYTVFYDWYVPAIIVLYLLFPFYAKYFHKFPYISTAVAVLIGLLLAMISNEVFDYIDLRKLLFMRIPIFALGVLFGKFAVDENLKNFNWKPLLYSATLVGVIILWIFMYHHQYYLWLGMYWFPFILIIPGVSLFIASVLDKYLTWKYIHRFLAFLGGISLEIYLFHLIPWRERDWFMEATGLDFISSSILVIIVGIGGAYLVSLITNKLVSRYKQKNNKNLKNV